MNRRDAETGPTSMQVKSAPAGKEANRLTAKCAHASVEVIASWEEMEDADSRAVVMRRLVESVRAKSGCHCGGEILVELGDE